MHFWINKGSQGCGFNGRYVPPSISAGTRRNQYCGRSHPKPMVTPVHRFQSIESVASGMHRHSRAHPFHTRFPLPPSAHHHTNGIIEFANISSSSRLSNQRAPRVSVQITESRERHTLTPVNPRPTSTAKLKCGVWAVIAIIPFFMVAANYYFNGVYVGMEALTFCGILILVLLIGGFVSLFEEFGLKRHRRESTPIQIEQPIEPIEEVTQITTTVTPVHTELPPPPYHLAVMLPTHNEHLIQDSPPPTYEKAVT